MDCFGQVLTIAALFLLCSGVKALPPPIVSVAKYESNLNAPLLVLDVNSLSPVRTVFSADACDAACRQIANSNAWVYCADPNGCGKANDCTAYTRTNPKLPVPPVGGSYRNQAMPITRFGGYASGTGCQNSKWPQHTCSCKNVAKPSSPAFWGADGTQWKTGIITVIAPHEDMCKGIPFAMCSQCTAAWSPFEDTQYQTFKQCMDCTKSVTGASNTLGRATAGNGCAWCMQKKARDWTYSRAACFGCVKGGGADLLPYVCGQ